MDFDMEKQLVPALAVFLFCLLYTVAIAAQTKSPSAPISPDKTRTEVQRLGFGKRVKVRLQNGTRIRGRITGMANDEFVVTDADTGAATKVGFADVAKISKQREPPRFIQGAIIGIAATAAVVGTLVVMALAIPD